MKAYASVGIWSFRDGKVVRERIYFGEPWEPPAWHAKWVEPVRPPSIRLVLRRDEILEVAGTNLRQPAARLSSGAGRHHVVDMGLRLRDRVVVEARKS